ncbi:hypothetical protein HK100_000232 [Physocladia obscura]|uniref:t-SNARE coiled-coil homology domain-containing protein n=1 Tax=Physocladia obscura TaxID=109957 RepID=A0AAD5SYS8_9FUNG|nr:hypothetical protein HK100_000232 [Physocladia obscura]
MSNRGGYDRFNNNSNSGNGGGRNYSGGGSDRARSQSRNEYGASRNVGRGDNNYRDNNNNYRDNSNNYNGGGGSKWAQAANAVETGRTNRYDGWENVNDEEENYDDEGWLSRKTRNVQNESADTTRRALQKARDAEELAARSLNQLNSQSEQLHRIEHKLDTADGHAKISEAKAGELKALNRWFFLPTFGASKKAKAAEDRFRNEMEDNERKELDRRENVRNGGGYYSGSADNVGRYDDGGSKSYRGDGGVPRGGNGTRNNGNGSYGNSYSTPDGLERDDLEEEIDGNLDEISGALSRLKMMGTTMGQEIESQTTHIRQINDKTDIVRDRVDKVNRDIGKINNKGKK